MPALLKYIRYTLSLLILSFALSSCLAAQEASVKSSSFGLMLKTLLSHTVPEVDVPEAAAKPANTVFLDARERKEYEVSHIAGARFVGYDHFSLDTVDDLPKTTPIVVYCSVGYRSEKISEQLITAGFQNVSNLYGGIFEWKNQGHTVVNPAGDTTDDVHAYNRTWGIWLKNGKKVY
jgi:rhodanese-related sulfurtransferase